MIWHIVTEKLPNPLKLRHFNYQNAEVGLDMYVDPNIIKPVASAQLHFISRVYDIFDKHMRWDRIALLSALHNVGYRTFGSPQPGQTSFPMRTPNSDRPIIAFDSFKQLGRKQLVQAEYIEDLISAFKRSLL